MAEKTGISWCDSTWNPWRGCTKVSAGCTNCYAEKLVTSRLQGEWGKGAPRIRSKSFEEPLKWNKKSWVCGECSIAVPKPEAHLFNSEWCGGTPDPENGFHRRRVFSLSLGDWLDDEVPIEWLADMLDVIRRCPNLDFLLLTKRPENWKPRLSAACGCFEHCDPAVMQIGSWISGAVIPANIWLGVSVENQATADERIPQLLQIPAVVRFVSYEPALGPVNFCALRPLPIFSHVGKPCCTEKEGFHKYSGYPEENHGGVDWIIVGGESGPKARPFNVEWARSTIAQCKAAGVACFVKQMGSNVKRRGWDNNWEQWKLRDSHGGEMSEWPEDLRIREFPKGVER